MRDDAGGAPVRYRFSRRPLPHWRRIHDGITALVRSFAVREGN